MPTTNTSMRPTDGTRRVRGRRSSTRTFRILAACAALALAGAGGEAARAATPRSGVAAQPVPPVCAWRTVSSAAQGTVAYPEGTATAWTTYYYAHAGLLLHIKGVFPYARYIAFSSQPVSIADDGSLTFQRSGDRLYDAQIQPDRGSVNPFRAGANRGAASRRYSLWVRPQAPPAHGHGNTLFAGTSGLGALTYRVYTPDQGRNAQGGVPLPTIDKVAIAGSGSKPVVIHVPLCAKPSPLRATVLAQQFASAFRQLPSFAWRSALPGDLGTLADEYQGYSSLTARIKAGSGLVVVRFKAPTFAATYNGAAITGREQVRYWSLCAYDLDSGQLARCVADYRARRDRGGYVTIVLGDPSLQPTGAALGTANWLPFSGARQGVLIYRQLLPSARFSQSLQRAPANPGALPARLGAYYPTIVACSPAAWTKNRCST